MAPPTLPTHPPKPKTVALVAQPQVKEASCFFWKLEDLSLKPCLVICKRQEQSLERRLVKTKRQNPSETA